jgi:hypothetical protein
MYRVISLVGCFLLLTTSLTGPKASAHQFDYVNPQAYIVKYSVVIDNVDATVNSLEIYMPFPKEYDCQ